MLSIGGEGNSDKLAVHHITKQYTQIALSEIYMTDNLTMN